MKIISSLFIYLRMGVQSEIIDSRLNSGNHADIILGIKDQLHLRPFLNDKQISERIEALESHPFGFDQWNADDYKAILNGLISG